MRDRQINQMILDKLEAKDIPMHVKGFIGEILQHENGGIDQERPQYTRTYDNLLNKFMLQQDEARINHGETE